jgi:hypothetical protein
MRQLLSLNLVGLGYFSKKDDETFLFISKPYFLRLFSSKREDGTFLCLRINKGYAHHASTFSLFFLDIRQI